MNFHFHKVGILFTFAVVLFSVHTRCRELFERIIEDQDIILSNDGVHVDPSYSEISYDENSVISAPGCPKSVDGLIPWVRYGNRCHFPGTRGPCEDYEVLLLTSPNSNEAFCACNWLVHSNMDELERSEDGRHLFSPYHRNGYHGDTVFHLEDRRCYKLHSQGPCETGHVLFRSRSNNNLQCVPEFKGHCGFNHESQICERREHLPFTPPMPFGPPPSIPSGAPAYGSAATGVTPNECKDDHKHSQSLKRCIKKQSYSFV